MSCLFNAPTSQVNFLICASIPYLAINKILILIRDNTGATELNKKSGQQAITYRDKSEGSWSKKQSLVPEGISAHGWENYSTALNTTRGMPEFEGFQLQLLP